MGAGVAAGPHCPVAVTPSLGGEAVRAGGFETGPEPGVLAPVSGVLRRAEARLQVSPRAPRQGRSPGGSPLGGSRTEILCSHLPAAWPKPSLGAGGILTAEAEGSAWQAMDLRPGPCRVRSSRAEARSCPTMPRSRSSRLSPVAAPGPKTGLPPDGMSGTCVPSSRLFPRPPSPKALWVQDGRFSKPAAFASAKGQARSFRLAAASSAAPPSRRFLVPGGARGPFRSGRGWEGDQPFPAFRLGHDRKLSRESESRQADSDCG